MAQVDHEDGYEEAEPAANSTQDDVAVPYSSTLPDARDCDSLAKTREAIEQVQQIIRERNASVTKDMSPAQIDRVLREKQEQLFGMLLAFQEVELTQLESSLNAVEKPQEGDLVQLQIATVQTTCNDLAVWKEELESILNSPQPLPVLTSRESEPSAYLQEESSSQLETSVTELRDKAQMLDFQCQGLLDDYTQLKNSLLHQVQSNREQSFRDLEDLEDLEVWLRRVYALLCLEPSKLWVSTSALSPWHQPKKESPSPRTRSREEPLLSLSQPSDDSLLEDIDIDSSPAEGPGLDRSVNPSLQDSEYMQEVDDMVISSPSDDGAGEEEERESADGRSTVCGSEGQPTSAPSLADELRDAGWVLSPSPPHRPPHVPVGGEGSAFDGSPLDLVEVSPDVQEGSPDSKRGLREGESPDFKGLLQETSPDFSLRTPPAVSRDASPNLRGASNGMSPDLMRLSHEAPFVKETTPEAKRELFNSKNVSPDHSHDLEGVEQVDHGKKSWHPRAKSRDPVQAPPLISTSDEGEGKEAAKDVSAKTLAFVRLKHSIDCEVGKIGNRSDAGLVSHDLESVLGQLKEIFEELGEKSNRTKAAIANVSHFMSNVVRDVGERTHLRERLAKLSDTLEPLRERVEHRITQLKFEKIQKAILDELVEAEHNLDTHLTTTNQMRDVIQQNLSSLKEFFTSPDHFQSQLEGQLKEMEAIVEQLLSFGKEDASLLGHTLQQLKNTCHVTCSRARKQLDFLEMCAVQWVEFDQCCGCLGDWLAQAKEKIMHEAYGSTLDEVASFGAALEGVAKELPSVDTDRVLPLRQSGEALLRGVAPGSPAHLYVQDVLSGLLSRWEVLSDQLQSVQEDVSRVLIGWKGYNGVKGGLSGFLEGMMKVVGSEAVASSEGDLSQLSVYKDHAHRVQEMEDQFANLKSLGFELASNVRVPVAAELMPREVEELEERWGVMREAILGTLGRMKREMEEWVEGKVTSMKKLIGEEDEMLSRMMVFVEKFPFESLLQVNLTDLSGEVEELVKYEERLDQLDNNFMSLEDEMPGEELGRDQVEQISDLQTYHHDIQQYLQTMGLVVGTFQGYLSLAQKIQEVAVLLEDACVCFGSSHELESRRVALQLTLSEDLFSTLEQEVVDLDSVVEAYDSCPDVGLPCTLPPAQVLKETNQTFASAVKELNSAAKQALERLERLIGQWARYEEGKGQLVTWVEEAEQRVRQLLARGEEGDAVPRVSPHELLSETKELLANLNGRDQALHTFYAIGQILVNEMTSSNATEPSIRAELTAIRSRQESLCTHLERFKERCEQAQYNYDHFLTGLGETNLKLCALEAMLRDDLCETYSRRRMADEVLCAQKTKLKGIVAEVDKLKDTYDSMCQEGLRWTGYLVHSDFLLNFASDSLLDEDQTPTVESRVDLVRDKWSQVQDLLVQRKDQLEMVTGDTASFLEALSTLLCWVRESLGKDDLVTTPTNSDQLRSFISVMQLLSCEVDGKRGEEKETLHHSYETLKPHLSKANNHKVEQDMLELEVKMSELRRALPQRMSELCPLRDKVEHFWSVLGEVKGWLGEMERRYEECGPIGAHLERLLEQGPILQAIDEECIAHKEDPDRICAKAADIAAVWGGGREELVPKAEQLRKQFVDFLERLLEQRERCEEAVAAMQQFQMEYDTFDKWLCEVQDKQRQWTEKKAPIGVIGGELEEYYDFMREVEGHTKQYSALRSHSERLASQYKPSDHLEGMMESVGTKWEGFVTSLDKHCGEKHTLKGRWEEYEREVKDLLGWMTQEANRFSREVTEKGEKGIEDHVESCQLFTDTLGAKVGCRDRVFSLGVELTSHDGMKKNGTSDVSSRIHDVQVHWECVCKLLDETILRLEATRAQMCYIQQVTDKEFDWLERCEELLSGLEASHGRREVIEEEISLLEGVAGEVVGHAHYKRFICEETEGFMLEHLRGRDREPTACKVRDFTRRYQSLSSKLGTCIGNLRESIPLWEHFSGLHGSLVQELSSARRKLGSANPSTFGATQKNLEVARVLSGGLGTMQHTLSTLDHVSGDLRPLCVQDDQNYIQQLVGVVSDDLDDLTNLITESVERLEHRMKSWEVLPVDDVMAVQEFLEQAQNVMMSSEGDETSEDMEEKVKMLESLLQSQDTNAQKVSSIDQSSKSEAVKKSLEKNPDISQEKDRLLNDWSTVSDALRQKFEETRRCISVTKELECLLMQCHKAMEEYQTFLSLPLPPSPQLEVVEEEMSQNQSSLHSSCEKAIAMVTSVLKRSLADGIAVPTHLQTKTQLFVEQFESLTSQASQRSRVVSHTLERWQSFTASMEKSTSQLSDTQSELASLVQVEEFLMELTSLESRLSILEEDLQTNLGELDGLRKDLPSHLFGDERHVIAKMADLSQLEQQWAQVKDCVHRLQMDLIPWRKLVDVQEELQNRFDQLKATAEEQFGLAKRSAEEQEDIREYLIVLKDCLLKLQECVPELDAFHQSYVSMLGTKVCSRHPPAQRFSEVCVALENDWRSLLERLKGSVEEMAVQAQTWLREAARCMREYRSTRALLDAGASKMAEQEERITALNRRLEERSTIPSFLSVRIVLLLLAAIVLVAAALYLGGGKSPPARHAL